MSRKIVAGDIVRWFPELNNRQRSAICEVDDVDSNGRVKFFLVHLMKGNWPVEQQYTSGCRVNPQFSYGEIFPLPTSVGDYARWEPHPGFWMDCKVRKIEDGNANCDVITGCEKSTKIWSKGTSIYQPVIDLRRIDPPQTQSMAESVKVPTVESTKVNGLTPFECWQRWRENATDIEQRKEPKHTLTPTQITAAKLENKKYTLNWSGRLRELITNSNRIDEARMVTVVLPDPDLETANTREPTLDEIREYNRQIYG